MRVAFDIKSPKRGFVLYKLEIKMLNGSYFM